MRNVLTVLVLGMSIALTGATAFAESERGGADHTPKFQISQAAVQVEPTAQGTIAGSSRELPAWVQIRYDAREH